MTPDLTRAAWRALTELAAAGLHVTAVADDGERRFHATTARGKCASGEDLEDVLLELAGRPRTQLCPRCPDGTGAKPLSHFARNEGRESGRNRYCRECESRRLRKYKQKRKAGPAAAAPTPRAAGPRR